MSRVAGKGRALPTILMHLLASTLAAATLGAALSLVSLPVAGAVGRPARSLTWAALALAFGLAELGLIRLPRPGSDRQVPARWRRTLRPELTSSLYGGIIGVGILTRISFASFHVVLAWTVLAADIAAGAGTLGVFGLARAVPATVAGLGPWRPDVLDRLVDRIMPAHQRVQRVTGVVLVAVAGSVLMEVLLWPRLFG